MAPWSPPSSARQALPDLLLRRRLAMEQLRSGPFCIVPMPPRQVPADAAASPVVVALASRLKPSPPPTVFFSHRSRIKSQRCPASSSKPSLPYTSRRRPRSPLHRAGSGASRGRPPRPRLGCVLALAAYPGTTRSDAGLAKVQLRQLLRPSSR